MAFATLPSPLYGLYRTRDHLSAFMITVIYAIFAAGTIATLLAVRSIAARIGRRGVMISAVVTMMVGGGVLAAWKALPGLLIGRLLTGASVGLAAGTAITYLLELRLRADPKAPDSRARTIGTSINVGALGVGPLIAGLLAQWAKLQLTLPYLVILGARGGRSGRPVGRARDGRADATPAPRRNHPTGPRTARLPVPAAAGTLAAFAANGLFAGLSGLFLATTLHRPSHALSGATLFLVFPAEWSPNWRQPSWRPLACSPGTLSMLGGPRTARRLRPSHDPEPRALLGRGCADRRRIRRGVQGDHRDRARDERTREPPPHDIGPAHRALRGTLGTGGRRRHRAQRGRELPNTVLGFAILVGLGVSVSGWALIGRRPKGSEHPA